MYPTFRIGATNPCNDPTVDPAGMSLQECAEELIQFLCTFFEGHPSLETQQFFDLEGKQGRFYSHKN